MKIKIWALQEIEVADDVLRSCHAESCEAFQEDRDALENLLNWAINRGDIDLPDEWRIHEDFDWSPLTADELENEIRDHQ